MTPAPNRTAVEIAARLHAQTGSWGGRRERSLGESTTPIVRPMMRGGGVFPEFRVEAADPAKRGFRSVRSALAPGGPDDGNRARRPVAEGGNGQAGNGTRPKDARFAVAARAASPFPVRGGRIPGGPAEAGTTARDRASAGSWSGRRERFLR